MPDVLSTRLSALADFASGNASLDTPAALRQAGTQRNRRRRGGAVLGVGVLGVGAVAAAVGIVGIGHTGTASPGAVNPWAIQAGTAVPPTSSTSAAELTAYQTNVLAAAHVTKAQVAALAKSGFTTAQIKALAAATAHLTKQEQSALTTARIAAGYLARYLTPAERAALSSQLHEGDIARQIAALAKARLSAAQLAALSRG
jgi:hypothetical protein